MKNCIALNIARAIVFVTQVLIRGYGLFTHHPKAKYKSTKVLTTIRRVMPLP